MSQMMVVTAIHQPPIGELEAQNNLFFLALVLSCTVGSFASPSVCPSVTTIIILANYTHSVVNFHMIIIRNLLIGPTVLAGEAVMQ